MKSVINFLWENGVGQNITASVILGAPTVILGLRKLKRHHDEIHAHLNEIREHMKGGSKSST